MPKLSQAASYGTNPLNNALSFRERLMERFQPHEYVRVINIDNAPITWQYLPSHSEHVTFTADPMKITHREDVEVYMLNPGESEVLLGENAYLMIENLYKQMAAKKAIEKAPKISEGQSRNFNFSDAQKQEEYIDRILLGKESPSFGGPKEESEDTVSEPKATRSNSERALKQHLKEQTT